MDKWLVNSGNTSVAANWNGGTLPAIGDDCYADGKAGVIDANFTCANLRTTQRSGGTAGGTFTMTAAVTLTMSGGFLSGTANGGLLVAPVGATVCVINGNSNGGAGANMQGIVFSGTGTLNYNGSTTGGNNAADGLRLTGTGTVNSAGAATGGVISNSYGINIIGAGTLNHVGAYVGASGAGINSATAASTINITGVGTAGANAAFLCSVASIISIIGQCNSSSTMPCVKVTNDSAIITASGPFVNVNNIMAVQCNQLKLYTASNITWTFQNSTGGNKNLYSAGVPLGNPATSDVRYNVLYGAALELAGTCHVPAANQTASGVPVDNTVGTANFTPPYSLSDIATQVWAQIPGNLAAINISDITTAVWNALPPDLAALNLSDIAQAVWATMPSYLINVQQLTLANIASAVWATLPPGVIARGTPYNCTRYNLGIAWHNEDKTLPFTAVQDGVHRFWFFVADTVIEFTADMHSGDAFEILKTWALNENRTLPLQIINPDGTTFVYTDNGVDYDIFTITRRIKL